MLHVVDAGLLAYRPAWDLQLEIHEKVLGGVYPEGALILVEHPAVITVGRRTNAEKNLLASPAMLAARGVELVETDRGGDVTFHGPGQLVAYPILPLNVYGLNLHGYLRLLEEVVMETVGAFGIRGHRDLPPCSATGVWVDMGDARGVALADLNQGRLAAEGGATAGGTPAPQRSAKIAAIGIKVRRWVTLHGVALNVTTDLSFFELINPCGLSRPVTSMQRLLGAGSAPAMSAVKGKLRNALGDVLARASAGAG